MAQQGMRKNDDDDDLKTSWPELVNVRAEYAIDVIHKDRPDVEIPALPMGTQVPPGYNDRRVILFVYQVQNFGPKVGSIPVVG